MREHSSRGCVGAPVAPEKTSGRRFSKQMVIANCLLAWAAVFLSIVYLQAAYVAASGMALVAILGGAYMGVGHLDLKRLLATLGASAVQPPFYQPVNTDPATPEDQLT